MDNRSQKNPMLRVLSLRDFKLLFAGAATSLLGDQFALIATPWLTLQLTGDPLALGVVLALEGIPRAVLMLLGGAITDRLSPRLIMLVADIIRLVLTSLMAVVVLTDVVEMWMLYVFGLGFGLVAGFAIPAENTIVPMLVQERDLQAGNSIMMGTGQLAGFIGPTVAGLVIGGYSSSIFGVGLAFAIDAASFSVSAMCLWLIVPSRVQLVGAPAEKESVWASIVSGIKYLWNDQVVRLVFLDIAAVNFLVVGPLLVGIPVLADQRLPEGAVAFGVLMSAFAGGNLIGYLVAGALPRPSGTAVRVILLALLAGFGGVIGVLTLISSTWVDSLLLFLVGLANGYMAILLFTWLQARTPREMLGRMMSILMFSNIGLVPVSQALAGAVSKWDLNALFASAGVLTLALTLWTALQPELTAFSDSLASQQMAEGGRRAEGTATGE